MILSEIWSSVRGLLQDQQFSTDKITEAANWWQDEIFANNLYRKMETTAPITALQGVSTADFPDDMQRSLSVWVTSGPTQPYDMNRFYMNHDLFIQRFPKYLTYPQQYATFWTDFGNQMRFSAPLKVDHVFTHDYIRRPVDMVASTDVCEIPDQYRQVISKGTLARIMEQNEDYGEAQVERQVIAPLVTTMIAREGRGQIRSGPVVMKSGRRPTNTDGWR